MFIQNNLEEFNSDKGKQKALSTICKNPITKNQNNHVQHFMLIKWHHIKREFTFMIYFLRNINACFKSEPALV